MPAAIVARELNVRLIETVCISSYENYQNQGELKLIKGVADEVKALAEQGKGVLIVDDLVDTGKTARMVRERGDLWMLMFLVCHCMVREDCTQDGRLADFADEHGGLLPSFQIGHDASRLRLGNDDHEADAEVERAAHLLLRNSPGTLYQSEDRGALPCIPQYDQRPSAWKYPPGVPDEAAPRDVRKTSDIEPGK